VTSLLVTGGTGTVGSAVVRHYLKTQEFDRIVVFSRDEQKQEEMRRSIDDTRMRYFLGDVRDAARLRRAMEGVDTVVHAAALKCIHFGETNPVEFIKTNVDGSINVVEAALDNDVRRVVAISTDKAVEPTCLYGHTKAVMESLVLHAKAYTGHRRTSFAVVRSGNIVNSRGSVIPFWNGLAKQGKSLPVTDIRMTRYWVPAETICSVIDSAVLCESGLVFTPPRVAFRLTDLLTAYGNPAHKIIGLRDGEKLHEKMDATHSSAEPDEWVPVEELKEAIACCS
jgi:UDP-N-acetylglucosamine 4,6-dehydratase/5-epimerase